MIRLFDFVFSIFGIIITLPIFILIYFACFIDTGSPLFLQKRLGKSKKIFVLIKFRSMKVGTVSIPTHLANSSEVTKFGNFLRKTKLDEIPQFWNILLGDMSLVGPRPGLLDQDDLTKERQKLNVYSVKPGITGLSQINNIDMLDPTLLTEFDRKMIDEFSLKKYFYYIIMTIFGKGVSDKIR